MFPRVLVAVFRSMLALVADGAVVPGLAALLVATGVPGEALVLVPAHPESNSAAAVIIAADPAKLLRVFRFIVLFLLLGDSLVGS